MTSPKQTDELRNALIEAGRAAGAFLSDKVSNEFLLLVPGEVKARIEHLQSENERKDAESEALRMALDLARARECKCPKPLPPGCYGNVALTKDQQP